MYKIQFIPRNPSIQGFELQATEESFVPLLDEMCRELTKNIRSTFHRIQIISPSGNKTTYEARKAGLAEYIRSEASARNITMTYLAKQMGISQPNLSTLLARAQTTPMSRKSFDKILNTHLFDNNTLMQLWLGDNGGKVDDEQPSPSRQMEHEFVSQPSQTLAPVQAGPKLEPHQKPLRQHWREYAVDPDTGRTIVQDKPGYDPSQDPNYWEEEDGERDPITDLRKTIRYFPFRDSLLQDARESGDADRLRDLEEQIMNFDQGKQNDV